MVTLEDRLIQELAVEAPRSDPDQLKRWLRALYPMLSSFRLMERGLELEPPELHQWRAGSYTPTHEEVDALDDLRELVEILFKGGMDLQAAVRWLNDQQDFLHGDSPIDRIRHSPMTVKDGAEEHVQNYTSLVFDPTPA